MLDTICFVKEEFPRLNESPLTMPEIAPRVNLSSYKEMFCKPGKIDKRKLPKIDGLHFQWYHIERLSFVVIYR